jgi:hypothetical protein
MVTKGGTNSYHGTGHFTFLDDSLNALPYGASSDSVGSWYQRFFGGTLGGPIIKDRLFFFGGFEGLRERRATTGGQGISSGASTVVVETEAFKNWVTSTRPNSVAANILQQAPPFRYATQDLVDVNNDGINDIGRVVLDRPTSRTGYQFNGRVDYLRGYIGQVGRAFAEGADVRGYYLWSFMDNFEWALGFSQRFGIGLFSRFEEKNYSPEQQDRAEHNCRDTN